MPHARLAGRAAALAAIAPDTAGDDILPVLAAAVRDRNHVIERQLVGREPVPAVLTAVLVAGVDVGAREGNVVKPLLYAYIAQQADDRRQLERDRNRAHFAVVDRDDLDLSLAPEGDCLLPVDDLEGLVCRVQEERLLHGTLYWGRLTDHVKRR